LKFIDDRRSILIANLNSMTRSIFLESVPMLTNQIYILQTYVYFFYISVLFYH
jgi:hypothetical protein